MLSRHRHRSGFAAALACATVVGATAACGNAPLPQSSNDSGQGITPTSITVGTLTDIAGFGSSSFSNMPYGVEAYVKYINAGGGVGGRQILLSKSDMLDDGGQAPVDLADAQKLVEDDHVAAILGVGTPFFNAGTYLTKVGVPAFGFVASEDWENSPNLFGINGSYLDYAGAGPPMAYAASVIQSKPVVSFNAYTIAQSQEGCSAAAKGVQDAGYPIGSNAENLTIGVETANVVAQKIAQSSSNVVVDCMDQYDNQAMSAALLQNDPQHPAQVWLNGYSRNYVKQNVATTNNVYFYLQFVPIETAEEYPSSFPGVVTYVQQMEKYEPNYVFDQEAIDGWITAAQFVQGLRDVGTGKLTDATLIKALNSETAFTADGLIVPVDWTTAHTGPPSVGCGSYVVADNGQTKIAFNNGPQVFTCFDSSGQKTDAPPGTPGTDSAASTAPAGSSDGSTGATSSPGSSTTTTSSPAAAASGA